MIWKIYDWKKAIKALNLGTLIVSLPFAILITISNILDSSLIMPWPLVFILIEILFFGCMNLMLLSAYIMEKYIPSNAYLELSTHSGEVKSNA